MYAITFLLCLFANAVALLARGARETAAGGIVLCALVLVYGAFQLAAPQTGAIRVAALSDWGAARKATRRPDLEATLAATREYADAIRREGRARLIVIPETSVAIDPKWQAAALAPLMEVARERHATIVIGVVRTHPMRNTALGPDGSVADYDKRHLLMPFEAVYRPGRLASAIRENRAVAICKDLDFPRTIRSDAYDAWLTGHPFRTIKIMAVPANDFKAYGWIHARMAVMRGVENGFAIVRAASNGLETVSDAQGRVIAHADTNKPGLTMISADVEPGDGPTLYTQIGDVSAWACIALSALLGALTARSSFLSPQP